MVTNSALIFFIYIRDFIILQNATISSSYASRNPDNPAIRTNVISVGNKPTDKSHYFRTRSIETWPKIH